MSLSKLKIKMMPSTVVIKNFVQGIEDCNYEIFMRELLNGSAFFRNIGESDYKPPLSEEAGQCDAISAKYDIDFKLLASQTELMASSILKEHPVVFSDGIVYYTECKKPNTIIKATRIHAALRNYSLEDLINLRNSKTRNTVDIDKDVFHVLEMIKTQKNVLLFFPYMLSFESNLENERAIEILENVIDSDFENLLLYRDLVAPEFDTFLTLEYNNSFIVFLSNCGKLHCIDFVPTSKMPTYEKLFNYKNVWE